MSEAFDASDIHKQVTDKAEVDRAANPPVVEEPEEKDTPETPEVEKPELDEKPAETDAEKTAKAQSGVQKRIDQLTREKNDARREAEYYRRMSEAKQEEKAPVKLSPDDFATYDDYVDAKVEQRTAALVAEHIQKQTQERAQQAHQREQQASMEAQQIAYADRESKISATIPDYRETMEAAKETPISEHMVLAILESDRGPEIAYYLAKKPVEAQRINALAPVSAVRAIGRIEAQLETEAKAAKAAMVSEAPEPLKPLRGGTGGAVGKSMDDMTQTEFNAAREKQIRKRFSG